MNAQSIANLLHNADDIRVKTIYRVTAFHDERGANQTTSGYCATRACAEIEARGNSFFGADGRVNPTEMIVVTVGDVEYYLSGTAGIIVQDTQHAEALKQQRLREQALEKLSEEERKALGLEGK